MSKFTHRTATMQRTAARLAAGAAFVATAAAAAGAQTTTPGSTSPATPAPTAGRSMTANATEQLPPGRPALREPVAEMYTDAKIAGVASTSNVSEIVPSQLAVQRAQNAQVKQYAQRMVTEHQRFEQQMQQMLQQKRVTPEHNGYSYQLEQNLKPMLQELQGASGAQFDKLYMAHQVSSHMNTLHALDTSLIPNARDPQMKTMLQQQVRPAVAAHYAEALRLQDAVAHGAMSPGAGH